MKTPKNRARDSKRSPVSEIDRRRAHLAAGGTIGNYDRSHYAKNNENKDPYDGGEDPNYAWTSESQDEMDKLAEAGHESMKHQEGKENLLDKSSQSKPPF